MAQRTIASFFKAPAVKPAGAAVPLRELTESDVNTRKRDAPHGDGGCVDHDERAPRGKRLSAPRSFEKGADVVSVPGTSGGTVSRPGDRPTRSLELVVVDGETNEAPNDNENENENDLKEEEEQEEEKKSTRWRAERERKERKEKREKRKS